MPDNSLNRRWPRVPPELAAFLDRRFPERCPGTAVPEREIWLYSGQRELVRLLLKISKEQEEALHETL